MKISSRILKPAPTLISLMATTALVLTAGTAALAQSDPAARESTPFTLETDQPRTPEQEAVRFDKADLSIRILPEQKAIDAVAVLDFTVLSPINRMSVELDTLYTISGIEIDGQAVSADRWSNPEGRLTIQLTSTLAAGTTPSLKIAYGGQPRTAVRAPWDGGFVWSTAPSGEPWIATAMQLEGCDLLFPCIDNSNAEPGQVDLKVTVPSNLSAPGNGVLVAKTDNGDDTTTWHWRIADPNIYAINITVGPYAKMTAPYQSRFGNTFPMTYWYLKTDDPDQVAALFSEFPQMLDFFESTIGPYPFGNEKMGVVETPHLGMEHQTINAYGNNYRRDGRGYDWLLQHEFSHEWFANQLTNRNADDMWLHEGLGSYMQPLYARYLYGDRYMQAELQTQREGLINRAPIVSKTHKTVDDVYNRPDGPGGDIYAKGSLVAHSLHRLIGDEAFFEALRRLVYGRPDPRPGNFEPVLRDTAEFNTIVNQVTGQDYDWFFDAYLYRAALPVLNQSRQGDRLILSWDAGDVVFAMPLDIEIDGDVQTVAMTGGRGEIRVPSGATVLVDPLNKVLRQSGQIDDLQAYQRAQRVRRAAEPTQAGATVTD